MPDSSSRQIGLALPIVTASVVLLGLLLPLGWTGLWDPHELHVAELGRRIAVGLLGDDSLRLDGVVNSIPVQRELGRGELPFTSIAAGFSVLGLNAWAGRLPLALWALVGIVASCGIARRLVDGRAALMTALVLATTPLYFVHAHVMLGYGVSMAGCAIALWGLIEICWPRPNSSGVALSVWAAVALVGFSVGYLSQGLLLGVSVPSVGVGLTFVLSRGRYGRAREWIGGLLLIVGMLSTAVGSAATWRAVGADYSSIVGVTLRLVPGKATHDETWRLLGHSLFPWTGAAAVSFGILFSKKFAASSSPLGAIGPLVLSITTVLALAVHGFLAPFAGHTGFVATPVLAVAIGGAFRHLELRSGEARVVAFAMATLTGVIAVDLLQDVSRSYAPFCLGDQIVPAALLKTGRYWIIAAALTTAVGTFFSLLESPGVRKEAFQRRDYLEWVRALRGFARGDLFLALGVAEILLMGLAVLKVLSGRVFHWPLFEGLSRWTAITVRMGWFVLPSLVFLVPWAALFFRDAARLVFAPRVPRPSAPLSRLTAWLRWTVWRPSRSAGAIVAGSIAGMMLSLGYYPILIEHNSPGRVFEYYRSSAGAHDELALLGVSPEVGAYQVGHQVTELEGSEAASAWLLDGNSRRWLVLRAAELPALNSSFRSSTEPATNLPILDSSSGQSLLASSILRPGEVNTNPLEKIVLSERPHPERPLMANLNDELMALGWEIRDTDGRVVSGVVPGESYLLRLYWEVLSPPNQEWTTFVHVDGDQRRFNGDHEPLGGQYPVEFWRAGDFLVDEYEFVMEPNFTSGSYQLYFGLFRGSERLPVKSGDHSENRVKGGMWSVL